MFDFHFYSFSENPGGFFFAHSNKKIELGGGGSLYKLKRNSLFSILSFFYLDVAMYA